MALHPKAVRATASVALVRTPPASVAAWLLPFGLVVYLGLKGGGYDPVVRGEVGVALWWMVLVGVATGMLAIRGIGRWGWLAVGLLAALAAWTYIGSGWSESTERTSLEVARIATYLGVLLLALSAVRHAGIGPLLSGLTAGIVLVSALALLSRLQHEWFPSNDTAAFLPNTASRLNFPFNYWNALAAFVALGLPLALLRASAARSTLGRAAATAALPVLGLTLFLTYSRGGALAAAIGVIVFLALSPDRLLKLTSAVLGAAGTAVLIAATLQRSAVADGKISAAARGQGHELIVYVLVVCLAVALLEAGVGLVLRYGRRPALPRDPRVSHRWGAVAAAVLVVVAVIVSGPWLSSRWEEFKRPVASISNDAGRFQSSSGNGRYQYWQSAVDAFRREPLTGIGAGTFEFWWARNGTIPGFIRDAHSLYVETLAELGIVGLSLLLALFGVVLARGAGRALRGPPANRAAIAAATAGCVAFGVSAGFDWVWEVAALPVAFLLLAAVAVGPLGAPVTAPRGAGEWRSAAVAVALAVAALVAVAIPLASGAALRRSQADARAHRLPAALAQAGTARRIEPDAATPRLQQALVDEAGGDIQGALVAARAAVRRERTNWRTWLVLSRLEARDGDAKASVGAYRRARDLNPRSPLFAK